MPEQSFQFKIDEVFPFIKGMLVLRGWLLLGTIHNNTVLTVPLEDGAEYKVPIISLGIVQGEVSRQAGSSVSAGEHGIQIDIILARFPPAQFTKVRLEIVQVPPPDTIETSD